jgi:hypothetical protein
MLAAEYPTLPGAMQASVVSFFDQNEAWLQDVLEQGRGDGSLHFTGPASDAARMIISFLEGAMLVTRPYGDIPRFQDAAASFMTSLTSPPVVQAERPRRRTRRRQPPLPATAPAQLSPLRCCARLARWRWLRICLLAGAR